MDYHDLPYDELKQLHRDIAKLLNDKKEETLETLRVQMENLGFTAADLLSKKSKAPREPQMIKRYRNEETGEEYKGKGPKPKWLVDAIADGHQLEDFLVH